MINFAWNPPSDKNTKTRIEKEIELQIVDVNFKSIRPLTININIKKENAEIVVYDKDNTKLGTFSMFDNGKFTIISSSSFPS